MDRKHEVPEAFLRNFMRMAKSMRTDDVMEEFNETKKPEGDPSKPKETNRTAAIGAEELAWADAAMLLCMPGPGLGGPPVRGTGTAEQRKRFFGMFKDMDQGELRWGAYGLTEPNAGSDVAGIKTSCRKDGKYWILNGRKCFITNGARAVWTVIFGDRRSFARSRRASRVRGREGHAGLQRPGQDRGEALGSPRERDGVVELVLEDCRVPGREPPRRRGGVRREGGAASWTAMKTFDNTAPARRGDGVRHSAAPRTSTRATS